MWYCPFMPLDEFGIRLLPAISGVLTIPVFYAMTRRLVGTRAALIGAFFVATSGLLVYVLPVRPLLDARVPAFVPCTRTRCIWEFATATAACWRWEWWPAVLAVLAHPVSVLLLGGLGVWIIAIYAEARPAAQLWGRRSVRWGAFARGDSGRDHRDAICPHASVWIQKHDQAPVSERGGEFLLHTPGGQGVKQLALLLVYVQNLTPPLVLAGAAGIFMLWGRSAAGPWRS